MEAAWQRVFPADKGERYRSSSGYPTPYVSLFVHEPLSQHSETAEWQSQSVETLFAVKITAPSQFTSY
ncbi:hypothetical protein Elgi_16400 [Paenibacillus elgii]|nr:hypothetical protein Elgi_16400 [Paenibacillus elgii]